jgi:hypothetical protein
MGLVCSLSLLQQVIKINIKFNKQNDENQPKFQLSTNA